MTTFSIAEMKKEISTGGFSGVMDNIKSFVVNNIKDSGYEPKAGEAQKQTFHVTVTDNDGFEEEYKLSQKLFFSSFIEKEDKKVVRLWSYLKGLNKKLEIVTTEDDKDNPTIFHVVGSQDRIKQGKLVYMPTQYKGYNDILNKVGGDEDKVMKRWNALVASGVDTSTEKPVQDMVLGVFAK